MAHGTGDENRKGIIGRLICPCYSSITKEERMTDIIHFVVEGEQNGYAASCVEYAGLRTEADDRMALTANIQEAVSLYFDRDFCRIDTINIREEPDYEIWTVLISDDRGGEQ
jgi:hypothetical protein